MMVETGDDIIVAQFIERGHKLALFSSYIVYFLSHEQRLIMLISEGRLLHIRLFKGMHCLIISS